jgi:hypothetical protein
MLYAIQIEVKLKCDEVIECLEYILELLVTNRTRETIYTTQEVNKIQEYHDGIET